MQKIMLTGLARAFGILFIFISGMLVTPSIVPSSVLLTVASLLLCGIGVFMLGL